jgi:tetratricopeptide (TPR) repeat protein
MADVSLKETALTYWEKGYKAQEAGRLQEAISFYSHSIEIFPTAEAHTFLGWAYSFQNRIDDAIAECKRAIEVDSSYGNPYNDIGANLIEQGDNIGAIPWLKKAMVAPRYACYFFPHFNLGRVYERQGRYLLAMHEYSRALAYKPNYKLALKAVRHLQTLLN